MTSQIKPIRVDRSDDQIQKDMERYQNLAIEQGATDAMILSTDQILIDERVRMKRLHPICSGYGSNIHCPPYVGSLEETRTLVKRYRYALFIMLQVPAEELVGVQAINGKTSVMSSKQLYEIVSAIESAAFYDGHHLALGFATGCKSVWCPDDTCSAIQPGGTCRHPLKARAGMDAMGMDVYTMATQVGWTMYPLGKNADPDTVPHGTRLGLILIT